MFLIDRKRSQVIALIARVALIVPATSTSSSPTTYQQNDQGGNCINEFPC